MKKVIRLTESDLMRIVKRVIKEQNVTQKNPWSQVEQSLSKVGKPKILRFKYDGAPVTSLNWGSMKESGHNWGLGFSSDNPELKFYTSDKGNKDMFEKITGKKLDFNKLNNTWSSFDYKLDYSNPTKVTSIVTQLLNSLS